jgi:methionyl-tRNA formyltransferase
MKYVFFGTPEFAAAILEKLIAAGLKPELVIANPDRPVGRKKIVTPPPTKVLAEKHGIKTYQPLKSNIEEFKVMARNAELAVVAAYAKIIPKNIIELFPKGVIGVHPSLLPKYRGASPIQTAILNGEHETGVSLYFIDEQVDHGTILAERKIGGIEGLNYTELHDRLAAVGGELLAETLPKYLAGDYKLQPQNDKEATYTKKFDDEDGRVDLNADDPVAIERKVRALNPEPGVWTIRRDGERMKRMKILETKLIDGKLVLKKIQWEGKKPQML